MKNVKKNPHAIALGRLGGKAGKGAYLHSLTPEQLKAHQQKAAKKRWGERAGDKTQQRP